VMASFAGDNSYGSSTSATALNVSPTTEASPTATITLPTNLVTTGDLLTYLVGGVIAIIVAIAIVGVLTYRKHQ